MSGETIVAPIGDEIVFSFGARSPLKSCSPVGESCTTSESFGENKLIESLGAGFFESGVVPMVEVAQKVLVSAKVAKPRVKISVLNEYCDAVGLGHKICL